MYKLHTERLLVFIYYLETYQINLQREQWLTIRSDYEIQSICPIYT
jgi:hypothetical protein